MTCLHLFITCCFHAERRWSQSINKHVSVQLDCVHKSAHRRVTGNAVLALHLAYVFKIKSFFSSPSFSSPALSSVIFQSCIFEPCTFVRHFPVLHFPPPWFLRSAIFQSCIFRRPPLTTPPRLQPDNQPDHPNPYTIPVRSLLDQLDLYLTSTRSLLDIRVWYKNVEVFDGIQLISEAQESRNRNDTISLHVKTLQRNERVAVLLYHCSKLMFNFSILEKLWSLDLSWLSPFAISHFLTCRMFILVPSGYNTIKIISTTLLFPDQLDLYSTSTGPIIPDHFSIVWLPNLYSTVSDMFEIVA